MRQWTESSLVQVMACCLFGTEPLHETMLAYCHLDSWIHIAMNFESEFYNIHSRKCSWICGPPKWQQFCPGRHALKALSCCGASTRYSIYYCLHSATRAFTGLILGLRRSLQNNTVSHWLNANIVSALYGMGCVSKITIKTTMQQCDTVR